MTATQNKTAKIVAISAAVLITSYFVFKPKTEKSSLPYDPVSNPGGAIGFNAGHVALALLDAMKTMGTNEQTIFDVLTPVNQVQFGKVVAAFGKRQYNSTTGNQINYFPVYQLPYVDLKGWLYSELSKENYATLRSKYPNYL